MSIYIPDNISTWNLVSSEYYTKNQINTINSGLCSLGTIQIVTADKTFTGDVDFKATIKPASLLSSSDLTVSLQDKAGTLALTSDVSPLTDINTATGEPHGFPNMTSTVISFDDAKLTFSITPTGADFFYYYKGTKKTKTGVQTVSITDTEGMWYFFYNNETLTASQSVWSITEHVPISLLYWNVTDKIRLNLCEERHGITMDSMTHLYLHSTVGTRYASGLTLIGTVLGNGSLDTHAQVAITAGVIYDEDIKIDISTPYNPLLEFSQNLSLPAQIPVWFRSGVPGYWRVKAPIDNFPVYKATSRLYYNATTWGLTECTNNYFVCSWIIATNDIRNPIICILGQRQDSSLSNSQANNTLSTLNFGSLPFAEMKPIFRLIYKTTTNMANSVAASLQEIQDLRQASSFPSGIYSVVDHSALSGLGNPNQHPSSAVSTTTTSFVNNLSAADSDVQIALTTINAFSNGLLSSNTTDATSTTSAGCVLSGGLGVSKSCYIGGIFNSTNTTDASSTTAASAVFSGGVGIAKKMYVAGTFRSGNTTDATTTNSASVVFSGGLAVGKKIMLGDGIYLPTSGGTASPLNYYEEYAHTTNFIGSFTASNVVITITRTGRVVCLQWPDILGTSSASQPIASSTVIPARFIPADSKHQIVKVQNLGAKTHGSVVISNTGYITFYKSEADDAFSDTNGAGAYSSCIIYSV
jgi:hypothetical protein